MRVYLVRHGQSQGNVHFIPGAVRPKTDPLTELGQKQAQQAACLLKSQNIQPTVVISSPYTRALDTAITIQKELGLPLIEDQRLGEYNPGDWDGTPIGEFTERFNKLPINERCTFRPPHGESWLDEARRINTVIKQAEANSHASIVLVSHYDPIRAVINLLTKQPSYAWNTLTEYPPGSVTTLDKNSDGWMLSLNQS